MKRRGRIAPIHLYMSSHHSKRGRRIHLIAILFILSTDWASSQVIREMEFRDQPVTDILLMIARATGTSIIPDGTVTGRATYYFSESELEPALETFLASCGYYLQRDGEIFRVSKVKVVFDPAADTMDFDADDVPVQYLLRRIARETGRTILFDRLPADPVSCHGRDYTIEKTLEMLAGMYREIELHHDTGSGYFYLRRPVRDDGEGVETLAGTPSRSGSSSPAQDRYCTVQSTDAGFRLGCRGERLSTVLSRLFSEANERFILLGGPDPSPDLPDTGIGTFEEVLGHLLDGCSYGYSTCGGIYYVYPVDSMDVLNRLFTTVRIPLAFIDAESLSEIIPPRLFTPDRLTFDRQETAGDAVVIFGSMAEIDPLLEFIAAVDVPGRHAGYRSYPLSFGAAAEIERLIPSDRFDAHVVAIPATNTLMVSLPEANRSAFEAFLSAADSPAFSEPIRLKFIDAATLMANLPPSISPDHLTVTSDPSLIFFSGPAGRRASFLRELGVIDVPVPQIRYELLVLQYQDGNSLHREIEIGNSVLERGSRSAFLGTIGNLLSLNFDVVSYFGYLFALRLNLTMAESKARILADTTLCGLAGREVTFKNTDTYRYRDTELDAATGTYEPTGITRQITTGLIIGIHGQVSGENMITMDIEATISKRGAESGSSKTILPATTEKVISTRVRTPAGEPVIIGSLIQQELSSSTDKVPGLGDIPLLKFLFSSERRTGENTELSICLVPRITDETDSAVDSDVMGRLYHHCVPSKEVSVRLEEADG